MDLIELGNMAAPTVTERPARSGLAGSEREHRGGAPQGADGGRGGSLEDPTGETVTAQLDAGGGGGGGGVGYIHIVSADIQLELVSPGSAVANGA